MTRQRQEQGLMSYRETSLRPLSITELLDADAVGEVLVLLAQESLINNPDVRLQFLSKVFAHVSEPPSSSRRLLTGRGLTAASPQCGPRWKWAEVVMMGVADPWSRIRVLSASVMADLLQTEMDLILEHQHRPAPRSSSVTALAQCAKCSPVSNSIVQAGANGVPETDATKISDVPSAGVSASLEYIWRRWRRTSLWYEQEGIVRVLANLYERSGTKSGDALRTDEAGLRSLLFTVLFPALRNAQLPVREATAHILGNLVDRRRSSFLSPAITSFVVDYVCRTLKQSLCSVQENSEAVLGEMESTRAAEGNLLALTELVDNHAVHLEEGDMMPLLLQFSSYPASSVRQYIAQILRPPSMAVFIYLVERLCEHRDCMPQQGDGYDLSHSSEAHGVRRLQGGNQLSWQRLETVMMALQQHLLHMLSTPEEAPNPFLICQQATNPSTSALLHTSLAVAFQATHSPCFEVARMGLQVYPLLLQFHLRFAPPMTLRRVCETCYAPEGFVQRELNRLALNADISALVRAQVYVATVVLPSMWWFLSIRRLMAEVAARREGGAVPVSAGETQDRVKEVVQSYATLEQTRFASKPHVGGLESSVRMTATCALLPLVTYFAGVMGCAEWHRCVEVLLMPTWWVELLTDATQRGHIRFGPDFVHTVHHHGTRDEKRRMVELIPTLAAAMAELQTHQQCLLVAMIRAMVSTQSKSTVAGEERPLSFVYHEAYIAPALIEGGDAVPLGLAWLRQFAPTREAIPRAALWGTSAETSSDAPIPEKSAGTAFSAVDRVCYRELYQSPRTEPEVLREIRALMTSLMRPNSFAPPSMQVSCYAAALAAIFGRLGKVCPGWWEADATIGRVVADDSWDDWDDDGGVSAQGISVSEEVVNAAVVVATLREHAAALAHTQQVSDVETRFRHELANLKFRWADNQL